MSDANAVPDGPLHPAPSSAGAPAVSAATRRGMHDLLDALDAAATGTTGADGAAHGYRPGHTLTVRTEIRRQISRRRTQISFGLLAILPIVLAVAFQFSSGDSGGAPALVDLATASAGNFALFAEFASVGFLLVVIVALFCGDTVAGEASWSTLRYLLAAPVPRARFLRTKLTVALLLSFGANLVLPIWSYVVGGLFYGWGSVRSPTGDTYGFGTAIAKLGVVAAYASLAALVVAALAFLLSVVTDAPLGAVGGAVMLVVLSNILDSITALGSFRNFLPTHYQFAWLDALQTPIVWSSMSRGAATSVAYAAVMFGFAFWWFGRKDVTS